MSDISIVKEYLERLSDVQRNASLAEEKEQILTEAKLFMQEFGNKSTEKEPDFISKMREWYWQQLERNKSVKSKGKIFQFSILSS